MNSNIERTVRVGIVGLGAIGHHHADRIVDLGHELVGGIDVDPGARERFEMKYGTPTYDTLDDLLAAGIDAVVVTTPNRYDEEYAVPALEAGASVLVEKPLAHTVESAERIAAAARDSEGICMVGFNNRFAAAANVIVEYRDRGLFGEITHVEANFVRRRGIPGRGTWFTSETVAGGGALIDIGVHVIDLAMHFLGYPDPVEVLGITRSQFGSRERYTYIDMYGEDAGPAQFDVEDSASAFLLCAGGKTVTMDVAWATNRPEDQTVVVGGTKAGAVFDHHTGDLTVYEVVPSETHHLRTVDVETSPVDRHRRMDEYFLACVASGEAPAINTVEQALTVQRIVDAVYRSSETGTSVRLAPPEAETSAESDGVEIEVEEPTPSGESPSTDESAATEGTDRSTESG